MATRSTPAATRWTSASEIENDGYDVYWRPAVLDPREHFTEKVVPGTGIADLPQIDTLEDDTAKADVEFYCVESVSMRGGEKRSTPIRAFELRPRSTSETVETRHFVWRPTKAFDFTRSYAMVGSRDQRSALDAGSPVSAYEE